MFTQLRRGERRRARDEGDTHKCNVSFDIWTVNYSHTHTHTHTQDLKAEAGPPWGWGEKTRNEKMMVICMTTVSRPIILRARTLCFN